MSLDKLGLVQRSRPFCLTICNPFVNSIAWFNSLTAVRRKPLKLISRSFPSRGASIYIIFSLKAFDNPQCVRVLALSKFLKKLNGPCIFVGFKVLCLRSLHYSADLADPAAPMFIYYRSK